MLLLFISVYLGNFFYYFCLFKIVMLDIFFNFNIVVDKKICYCTIDLSDSYNLFLNLPLSI